MKTILNEKQYAEYEKLRAWYDEQADIINKKFGADEEGYADMYYEHINTIYNHELEKIMLMD